MFSSYLEPLLGLECLEVPVALEVQGVLQAPQRCYPEYRGFLGCPVAPVDPAGPEDRVVLAQTSFFLFSFLSFFLALLVLFLAAGWDSVSLAELHPSHFLWRGSRFFLRINFSSGACTARLMSASDRGLPGVNAGSAGSVPASVNTESRFCSMISLLTSERRSM